MFLLLKYLIKKKIAFLKLLFTQTNNNNIFSVNVCAHSLKGEHIDVREGTHIDANSSIGSYSYIGSNCSITKTTVGSYCSIANNVSIGQGEHKLSEISTSSVFYNDSYELLTTKNCTIGHDVWIGVDAIILRGVTIGDGAVIGANAVVTKDIPSFSIAVGTPARVIKYRFNEEKIKLIKKSQWWNYKPNSAKEIFKELEKI